MDLFYYMFKQAKVFAYLKTQLLYRPFFGNIGRRTSIYKPNRILNPRFISVGDNTVIEKEATLYSVGKYNDNTYNGVINIGSNVYINYNFNATSAYRISIQDDVTIAYNVSIFDFNHDYSDPGANICRTDLHVTGEVVIGKMSWIGMNVTILGNVTIGCHCVIGANSVVTKNIPDYSVAVGNPAVVIKKYDFNSKTWKKVEKI